jgi:hypothetical protein
LFWNWTPRAAAEKGPSALNSASARESHSSILNVEPISPVSSSISLCS